MVVVAIIHEDFKYMFKRHSRGIGLLELMLSTAIIALVIIMATRYFSVTREQQKITQTLQASATVLQAVHTWGQNPQDYTNPFQLLGVLVNAQLLPPSYARGSGHGYFHDLKGKATPYLLELWITGVPGGSGGALCQSFHDRIQSNLVSGVGYKIDIICQ
jgi:type II secretory pathway pseudopilin PulG